MERKGGACVGLNRDSAGQPAAQRGRNRRREELGKGMGAKGGHLRRPRFGRGRSVAGLRLGRSEEEKEEGRRRITEVLSFSSPPVRGGGRGSGGWGKGWEGGNLPQGRVARM